MNLNIKQWTIAGLLLLGLVGGYHYGYWNVFGQTIVAVTTALLVNIVIDYIRVKKFLISESAIISGLIIAMVVAPNAPLLEIGFLSALAIASKYLIKFNKRPLFNPAGFSLLIGVLIFKLPLGWWADYNHLLTIAVGTLLMIKMMERWKSIYAFLITLGVLIAIQSVIMGSPLAEEFYFKLGIAFFFTFFMLTDPKTSPLMADQFIVFGMITAIVTYASILWSPSTTFIAGLLVTNAFVPFLNYRSMQKIRAKVVVKPEVV